MKLLHFLIGALLLPVGFAAFTIALAWPQIIWGTDSWQMKVWGLCILCTFGGFCGLAHFYKDK